FRRGICRLCERVDRGANAFFVPDPRRTTMGEDQLVEEGAGAAAQTVDGLPGFVSGLALAVGDQRQRAFEVSREPFASIGADAVAEVLRGDVLELVGLVQNRAAARRNHFPVRALTDSGIGTQQMM